MSEYILEMKNISKSFSGVQVLDDVSLKVKPGEVHVLIGENGAGKSTLIKILSGAYKKETGEVWFNDGELNIHDPKEALNIGISVIYQEFILNPYLAIYENIFLGKEYTKGVFVDKKRMIEESARYLKTVGFDIDPKTKVGVLSVAQKQMVEIAKAISMDVRLLVLDEPTAAITETETQKLFNIVRDLKSKGIGIIYISHRMKEIFEIGDRCTVLRDGKYVDTKDIKDVTPDDLTKMMVGRSVVFVREKNTHRDDSQTMLQVNGLCYKNLLKDISFDLKKGEILGVAGLIGAGRTEMAKCIIGAYKRTAGEVICQGEKLKGSSPKEAISKGIVYLSEDRKDEGLVIQHSVKENICLPNLKLFGKIFLSNREQRDITYKYIDILRIKTSSHAQPVKNLSGGNQQKVVIGKWLCSDAKIYIFDEPTRGIDVGAREEIYALMNELLAKGASIIMISSDLVEVLKMSDRLIVMNEGRIKTICDNDECLTQQKILSYAINEGESI